MAKSKGDIAVPDLQPGVVPKFVTDTLNSIRLLRTLPIYQLTGYSIRSTLDKFKNLTMEEPIGSFIRTQQVIVDTPETYYNVSSMPIRTAVPLERMVEHVQFDALRCNNELEHNRKLLTEDKGPLTHVTFDLFRCIDLAQIGASSDMVDGVMLDHWLLGLLSGNNLVYGMMFKGTWIGVIRHPDFGGNDTHTGPNAIAVNQPNALGYCFDARTLSPIFSKNGVLLSNIEFIDDFSQYVARYSRPVGFKVMDVSFWHTKQGPQLVWYTNVPYIPSLLDRFDKGLYSLPSQEIIELKAKLETAVTALSAAITGDGDEDSLEAVLKSIAEGVAGKSNIDGEALTKQLLSLLEDGDDDVDASQN